jgi:hypothetical protein
MTPTGALVRHADVTAGFDSDPPLNAAAKVRARALRDVLADTGISAIFVTFLQRSQATAVPLAKALNITPAVIDEVDGVVTGAEKLPSSTVVLVIGHTNTPPEICVGLGGPALPPIDADEFDRLFVVAGERAAHLRYGAAST